MSRHTAEHESVRLYGEEESDDRILADLYVRMANLEIAIDEVKARKAQRRHTYGTLNPGKPWGSVA